MRDRSRSASTILQLQLAQVFGELGVGFGGVERSTFLAIYAVLGHIRIMFNTYSKLLPDRKTETARASIAVAGGGTREAERQSKIVPGSRD